MGAFIDILLMRVPPVLGATLGMAFFSSLLAIYLPGFISRIFHAVESRLSRLAERTTLVMVAVFFIVLGVRIAVLPRLHRSEEHTSELQSQSNLVCRLLLEKKNQHSSCPRSDRAIQILTDRFTNSDHQLPCLY